MIRVLLFGQLSDLAELGEVEIKLPQNDQTVAGLKTELANKLPRTVIELLKDGSLMVSVNQQLANWQTPLADGDEVALMPPVSGG